MRVILSPRTERQLRKLQKVSQIIIAKKIRVIRDNYSVPKEEQLRGYKNIYRVRVGDFRIVYRKTKREIYIIALGHRKDIYQKLKKLLRK